MSIRRPRIRQQDVRIEELWPTRSELHSEIEIAELVRVGSHACPVVCSPSFSP